MLRRIILIGIVLAALAAVIVVVDFRTLIDAVASLPTTTKVLVLLLAVASAIVKAVRWAYYLRAARLDISWKDGMTSYLAGMSVGALPGGSWLPPRLAQEHGDVKMREAAAGLFVGFVSDTLALALLAWLAMVLNHKPGNYFLLPGLGIAMALTLIAMGRSERLWRAVDRLLARFRFTRQLLPKEEDIHARVAALMRAPVVARGVGFSAVTTLLAATMLLVIVDGLTFRGVSPLEALYVHTYSESAAMVIPVPGGYGVSDSSIAGLLASLSIGFVRATYVVIAVRSADLIFRTVAGTIMLLLFYRPLLRSALQLRRRAGRAWRLGRRWSLAGARVLGITWFAGVLARLRRQPPPVHSPASAPTTQPGDWQHPAGE